MVWAGTRLLAAAWALPLIKVRMLEPEAEQGCRQLSPLHPPSLQAVSRCRCGALSSPHGMRSHITASTAWRTAGSTSHPASPSPACTTSWTTTAVRSSRGQPGASAGHGARRSVQHRADAAVPTQSVGRVCAAPSGSPAPRRWQRQCQPRSGPPW